MNHPGDSAPTQYQNYVRDFCFPSDILECLANLVTTIFTAPAPSIPNFDTVASIVTAAMKAMNVYQTINKVLLGSDRDRSLEFFHKQRHLEVSDSRDKIYGFLGLLRLAIGFFVHLGSITGDKVHEDD